MTLRNVDLALRHKVLLLIPILLGLIAGVIWTMTSIKETYFSTATIWVERPTTETGGSFIDFNQWISPAQNQVNSMRELLSTRTFRADVLERVYAENPPTPFNFVTPGDLTQKTYITPMGTHAVSLGHQSSSPEMAYAVVNAILQGYNELYTTEIIQRAETSQLFFEEQLQFASGNLERAHTELNGYLAANPIAVEEGAEDEPLTRAAITAAAASDLELARLVGAEETARQNYDRLFAQFAETQIAANAASEGTANFRILDPPEVPTAPQGQGKRELLLKPMLGIVAGTFISGGLFILISRLDRHVWLPADIQALGLAVPIMTLPRLKQRSRKWPRSFLRLTTAMRNGLRGPSQAYETDSIS